MKRIGAHVSIAGGVENAPLNAAKIGASAFAMFTKNQRQWQAKPFTEQNISSFKENLKEIGVEQQYVLCHDSYLINLGNADRQKRQKSLSSFIDEAKRVEQLGLTLLNFHPGSHLKQVSEEQCMDLIAEGVKEAINRTDNVVFVLETTAGQGTNIGYTFEHLAYIIDKVGVDERMGVCIDTCHIFTAGYDIKSDYDNVMAHFGKVVGFDMLKGMHLNDSKSELGQKVDRHHSLGQGYLGIEVFQKMMQDSRLDNIPMVLETIDQNIWPEEIAKLNSFV